MDIENEQVPAATGAVTKLLLISCASPQQRGLGCDAQ